MPGKVNKNQVLHRKVCTKCGVGKPLEKFGKDKRRKDGRGSHCYECCRARGRSYQQSLQGKVQRKRWLVKLAKRELICDNCHRMRTVFRLRQTGQTVQDTNVPSGNFSMSENV
jgi:hypothetical protein